MSRSVFALIFCLSAFAQTEAPASPPAAAQEPFRASVREVIVPVTVTDLKGRFVSDLDSKDFKVFDEGKEQKIQFFTRERSQPPTIPGSEMNVSRPHSPNHG